MKDWLDQLAAWYMESAGRPRIELFWTSGSEGSRHLGRIRPLDEVGSAI